MRLQLDPKWAIDWDGQCYTLVHFTVITGEGKGAFKVKAENIGKTKENLMGYYGGNFRNALLGYVNKSLLEGDGTCDVAGLLARMDQLEAVIAATPKPAANPVPATEPEPVEAPPAPIPTTTVMDL